MRFRILFVAGMLAGCTSEPKAPQSTTQLDAVEYHAAREMAAARCDRRIGTCARYPSREECVDSKILPSATDANLLQCSSSLDEDRLSSCLSAIRQTPCGSGIHELEDCREDQLCSAPEEGTL